MKDDFKIQIDSNSKNANETVKLKSYLYLVRKAISNLRKDKEKLSISKISKVSGISRKTFYNVPELKELCEQAISQQTFESELGHMKNLNSIDVKTRPTTAIQRLEKKYARVIDKLEKEKKKNEKLLINNKKLVLDKQQLKNKMKMLENKIERMKDDKVKKMK